MATPETKAPHHFIQAIVEDDLKTGKNNGRVATRFPPEPNGYLHIGHAKAICLDFGIAKEFGGICHLRFDDTNPTQEEQEFVDAIREDLRWLGFEWGDHLFFASDYFSQMYEWAVKLIQAGKAYVCTLTPEEFKDYRGVPTHPGKDSPHRDRSIEENLDLFKRMKEGEFADGAYVLRAKIDMTSPNLHLRDPAIYRIKKAHHHRTGDEWCVYPMYDYAHCIEDSIERITHSLCTLEFEVHRPLYDWILDALEIYHPQQIEFARLKLSYNVLSKRKLQVLVEKQIVSGWDDPRMPTLAGLRRRGFTPSSIRNFCEKVGITKYESLTDLALLEHAVRDDLNWIAPRRMAVLRPLKVVIENYPKGESESFDAVNNPEDDTAGARKVPFSRELYIEQDDFMEHPPRKFRRLALGREVRLRAACYITCTDVIKDSKGEIIELRCTFDPASRGGSTPDGRKIQATIHWVSAEHACETEIRLYDRLFTKQNPADERDGTTYLDHIHPDSFHVVTGYLEPSLALAEPGSRYQFERIGYFCADIKDSAPGKPVFNRIVTLRDSWTKKQQAGNR